MEYSGGVYTLYYVLANPSAGGFILGAGTLGDNGAVNGLTQTQFGTIWTAGDSYPCVYGTPTDVLVGIATSKSGAYQLEIYHIGASSKQVLSKVAMSTGAQVDGCIALGLTSGYALVYGAAAAAGPVAIITSANGNVWSAPTTVPTTSPITMSSAVAMGNTVNFATVTNAGEQYLNCAYPCSTTSTPLTLASGTGYDNVVLSTNGRSGGASIDGDLPQQPRAGLVSLERRRREHVDAAPGDRRRLDGDYRVRLPPGRLRLRAGDRHSGDHGCGVGHRDLGALHDLVPGLPCGGPLGRQHAGPVGQVGLLALRVVLLPAQRVRLARERAARGLPDRRQHPRQGAGALGDAGLQPALGLRRGRRTPRCPTGTTPTRCPASGWAGSWASRGSAANTSTRATAPRYRWSSTARTSWSTTAP